MTKIRSEFPQTPLKLTLREEQISTILYCLEGYVQGNDDEELVEELDEIFEVLETTVDKFYNKIEKARAKQPEGEW
jgi:predicted HAD superfamily phosphohydrolase